jgi:plastocyanin
MMGGMPMEGMTMPTATPDMMGGMTMPTATPDMMGGMTMPTATPAPNTVGGTPAPTATPGSQMMGGMPMEGMTMPTATPAPDMMGGMTMPAATPNTVGGTPAPTAAPAGTPMPTPYGGIVFGTFETTTVSIQNMAFTPDFVETMNGGITVTWVNRDSVPHTVTGLEFDSGPLAPGASFTRTFTPATVNYWCAIHPTMKGTVDVMAH